MLRCLGLGGLALCLVALTTAPAKASGPTVVTEPASNVGATSATLNGYVDPAGGPEVFKCYFEYGSGTTYGGMAGCIPDPTPPFTAATHVSADISGLQSNATYHFRLVAVVEPSEDQFTYGADQTFCTSASCASKPPAAGVAPGNIKPPAISGNVRAGRTVYCSEGAWSGDMPQTYTFTWLRDGSTIVSGPSSLTTYAVRSNDSGHQLSCRIVAANGAGSASATSSPVTVPGVCTPSTPPRAVVVLLMGLNSSLRGSSFNPLAASACDAASSGNPSLHDLGEVFDNRGLGSSGPTLMTSLAKTGAVILPYSYAGAYFDRRSTNPRFVVNGYRPHVPNEADIITQDWVLDSELQSIRGQWPNAKLFVIGHSEGGLIAKQWWRNWDGHHSPAPNHATTAWNVNGVFSLDGPINGGSNPFEYLSALGSGCPILDQLPCATLAQQFSALWYYFALKGDDTTMARADTGRHGIFTPIGTRGDLIMEVLSMSGKLLNVSGEELGPQLFANFDSDGQINTLIQPGRITPTAASSTEGFESHKLVYREPANVRFLTNAVERPLSARVQRRFRGSVSSAHIQMSSAGPSGSLASPVAGPGGTVMVAGSGFGTTPGQVSLIDPHQRVMSLSPSAWSPTMISAAVPDGATEGLVIVETSDHESFIAGSLTILGVGSTGVAELQLLPGPLRAIDNQPIEVRLKAVRSDGSPAAGAPVTISDGLQSTTQTTDSAGVTKMAISGAGSQVIARSGQAWVGLPLRWSNPAMVRFGLRAGGSRRGNRRTVVARVHLRHGGPARDMAVTYRVMRRATGRIVRRGSVKTDRRGEAILSFGIRGALVVTATTNFGFATRQVVLRPRPVRRRSPPAPRSRRTGSG
jgi:hypothetical protein